MSGRPHDKVVTVKDRLIGSWKLVSAVRKELPSGQKTDFFGPNPHGFLNYGPDGRMIALLARGDRNAPAGATATPAEAAALFKSMLSYAGSYTVDGNEITHEVDISWNESFTGTKQKRTATLTGNRLTLSPPPSRDPLDGTMSLRTLTWEKV
jgi:hypothetical protein